MVCLRRVAVALGAVGGFLVGSLQPLGGQLVVGSAAAQDAPNAAEDAQAASIKDPKQALEQANRALLEGSFAAAVALGKRALKLDPKLSDAQLLVGVAYARQGAYCSSKLHYEAFLAANPKSAKAARVKAILEGQELKECPAGSNAAPAPVGNAEGKDQPDLRSPARAALDAGHKAILLNDFAAAIAHAQRALKLEPTMADAHKVLGVAYARQGRYCDAKVHYQAFIQSSPNTAAAGRVKMILEGEELRACP